MKTPKVKFPILELDDEDFFTLQYFKRMRDKDYNYKYVMPLQKYSDMSKHLLKEQIKIMNTATGKTFPVVLIQPEQVIEYLNAKEGKRLNTKYRK